MTIGQAIGAIGIFREFAEARSAEKRARGEGEARNCSECGKNLGRVAQATGITGKMPMPPVTLHSSREIRASRPADEPQPSLHPPQLRAKQCAQPGISRIHSARARVFSESESPLPKPAASLSAPEGQCRNVFPPPPPPNRHRIRHNSGQAADKPICRGTTARRPLRIHALFCGVLCGFAPFRRSFFC